MQGDGAAGDAAGRPPAPATRSRTRRCLRRAGTALAAIGGCVAIVLAASWVALDVEGSGTPSATTRGSGHDAEWLGHAWVDGRKGQSDVDALAVALRRTGIHDLFVHAGPLRNDGTLDPGLIPRARWVVGALHAALPGVRVQAWLGAHPVPGQLRLDSSVTRALIIGTVSQVLDDGFDGVHYDFEPVEDGNPDLPALLSATHELTRSRGRALSLSASYLAPLPGTATAAALLPGYLAVWSPGYLHRLAGHVDQVAFMAYDTSLLTRDTYAGYVRHATELALRAVPVAVTLFIGLPAYHDDTMHHRPGVETVPAALRGVRLALGTHPAPRAFGVAMYVDFAATAADWTSYRRDWADTTATR